MRRFLIAPLLLVLTLNASAQKTDKKLQGKLVELTKGINGVAGIYVKNLNTGKIAVFNADSIFPTASMIKVPIMAGLFEKLDRGDLNYSDIWQYRDSLSYDKGDVVGSLADSAKINLSKVQMLSITTSDNTASLWIQKIVGGENINNWLDKNGFKDTRVNSRTPGRQANQKLYGWGQTTPREMATLVEMIRNGKAVSEAASERMYRNMSHIYWDDKALSQIPPTVQTASKQGAVDASRSEVVLVNAPHGDYVFCIITKNLADTSWTPSNEGWQLIVKTSDLLWHYFEPKSTWTPSGQAEKFKLD
ncbi:serine hydrolase [Pedobacter sp. HMF7647]|uniref:Serine hydrolase n=1 Tax=Hufsiella arboris TaxID=2695275 RepID=A0A7K1YAF7_9SPHI|nr:serine hydrolase [Hufsiella arboris]MXV51562.1 serine hydrolase [Hufsiella arboris]